MDNSLTKTRLFVEIAFLDLKAKNPLNWIVATIDLFEHMMPTPSGFEDIQVKPPRFRYGIADVATTISEIEKQFSNFQTAIYGLNGSKIVMHIKLRDNEYMRACILRWWVHEVHVATGEGADSLIIQFFESPG